MYSFRTKVVSLHASVLPGKVHHKKMARIWKLLLSRRVSSVSTTMRSRNIQLIALATCFHT